MIRKQKLNELYADSTVVEREGGQDWERAMCYDLRSSAQMKAL